MKRVSSRFAVLMAAMMMTMMSFAKTQDFGGRVLDEKGLTLPGSSTRPARSIAALVPARSRRRGCSATRHRIMQRSTYGRFACKEYPIYLVHSATILTFATSNRHKF